MRNRHIPRLCRNCTAPMASQDECWRCGVEWAPEEGPRTTLHLISGDAPAQAEDAERPDEIGNDGQNETLREQLVDHERRLRALEDDHARTRAVTS